MPTLQRLTARILTALTVAYRTPDPAARAHVRAEADRLYAAAWRLIDRRNP